MSATRGLLLLIALLLAGTVETVQAADLTTHHRRTRTHVVVHRLVVHRRYVLPPERHVVEKVMPPFSGNYLINATRFTAQTQACAGWVAGDRIRLVAGDWRGFCTSATFYNVSRRMRCTLSCSG